MADIRNYSQLKKFMQKAMRDGMKDVGKEQVATAKDSYVKVVENSYSPESYIRTNELKESISYREIGNTGDTVEVEIFHDTSKIYPNSPNQHMSVIDGSSSVDYIANIVHDGLAPNIFNNRDYPWEKPRPYMDKARQEIEGKKLHIKTVKESLRRQGIKTD